MRGRNCFSFVCEENLVFYLCESCFSHIPCVKRGLLSCVCEQPFGVLRLREDLIFQYSLCEASIAFPFICGHEKWTSLCGLGTNPMAPANNWLKVSMPTEQLHAKRMTPSALIIHHGCLQSLLSHVVAICIVVEKRPKSQIIWNSRMWIGIAVKQIRATKNEWHRTLKWYIMDVSESLPAYDLQSESAWNNQILHKI